MSVSENATYAQKIPYRFVPVPESLVSMDACPLRAQLIHFWQVIYKNSTAAGFAWFKRETVATWLGVSIRTISRWIRALKEKRLLWVARTGRSSEYTLINMPVENLRKVTPEAPKMAHRIKDDLDLKPIESISVGSNTTAAVQKGPEKAAADAAPSLKTIPTEEFLAELRRLKHSRGAEHAQAAQKTRGKGGLTPAGEITRGLLERFGFKKPPGKG